MTESPKFLPRKTLWGHIDCITEDKLSHDSKPHEYISLQEHNAIVEPLVMAIKRAKEHCQYSGQDHYELGTVLCEALVKFRDLSDLK